MTLLSLTILFVWHSTDSEITLAVNFSIIYFFTTVKTSSKLHYDEVALSEKFEEIEDLKQPPYKA